MSFQFDPALPLPRAARKAALDELRGALAHLRRGTVRDVHEVRKSTKKLRAWARLLRPVLEDDYVVVNRLLRDAARALAGNRDRTVARATLSSLGLAREDRAEVLAQALQHLPAGTRRQRAGARRLSERLLRVARLYLQRAPLTRTQPKGLHKRLLAIERRCRAVGTRARRRPTATQLHEWRKLAKYQSYQRAMLAPLFRDAREGIGMLKRLGDVLGRHHDLALLANLVRRQETEAARRALAAIRGRQLELERRAFELGAAL